MSFSNSRKQRICNRYSAELTELIRGHFFGGDDRVNNLIAEMEESDMKISDIDCLVSVAGEFHATYELLPENLKDAITSKELKNNSIPQVAASSN